MFRFSSVREVVRKLDNLLAAVLRVEGKVTKMAGTQADLTTQIQAISGTLTKIGTETTTLLQKVSDLNAVIANGPPVSAELQAAVNDLAAQAKVVDDLVPDAIPLAPTPGASPKRTP